MTEHFNRQMFRASRSLSRGFRAISIFYCAVAMKFWYFCKVDTPLTSVSDTSDADFPGSESKSFLSSKEGQALFIYRIDAIYTSPWTERALD